MTTTDYLSEQEFLDYIKSNADIGNDNRQTVITAASRAIDSYCGRRFYSAFETRYFSPNVGSGYVYVLNLGGYDLANLDDLEVATGTGGTYPTTLTITTDFYAQPLNRPDGWPYESLRTATGTSWPIRYYGNAYDTVQITGNFGWPEVPAPVTLATKLLAAQYYKLADAPLGVAGFGEFGPVRVREIPQVATLLDPYRTAGTFGIA